MPATEYPDKKSKVQEEISEYIKCSCSCQILEAQVYNYEAGDLGVNFVIWGRGKQGKQIYGWKEKFRWCWQIIRTGNIWADDIIATNKDARKLAKFILQNTKDEESKSV